MMECSNVFVFPIRNCTTSLTVPLILKVLFFSDIHYKGTFQLGLLESNS